MQVNEAIRTRKSVRSYRDEPVPPEVLETIIEAGQWAPNAGPFLITVIRNESLRQRIDARTKEAMLDSGIPFLRERASLAGYQPLYGAPVVLLLSGPKGPYTGLNAALAAENMILEATAAGLASCFIVTPAFMLSNPANNDLARAAEIPEDHIAQCAVLIGHGADNDPFSLGERVKKGEVRYLD
ncbi:MAG: nitroreductase family protein [Desulfobulbus sp.]|jgi:FMN reductase [NAD(P)H]